MAIDYTCNVCQEYRTQCRDDPSTWNDIHLVYVDNKSIWVCYECKGKIKEIANYLKNTDFKKVKKEVDKKFGKELNLYFSNKG
jgi:hypothetical protein